MRGTNCMTPSGTPGRPKPPACCAQADEINIRCSRLIKNLRDYSDPRGGCNPRPDPDLASRGVQMTVRDQRLLARIAAALERLAPAAPGTAALGRAEAFVWHSDTRTLTPIADVNRVELALLKGVDR